VAFPLRARGTVSLGLSGTCLRSCGY
jgi:hypothetical protein